jgi:fucose permease
LRPKTVLIASCAGVLAASAVLVVGDGRPAPVWVATAVFGFTAAPQFPVMLTYLERRIHVTGYATSWIIGAAGIGGLVFPWLIGQWIDAAGAAALPWSMLALASATIGSFAWTNRRLGG